MKSMRRAAIEAGVEATVRRRAVLFSYAAGARAAKTAKSFGIVHGTLGQQGGAALCVRVCIRACVRAYVVC